MYRNPSGCHVWCTLHHSQSGLSSYSLKLWRTSKKWCKGREKKLIAIRIRRGARVPPILS